MVPSGWAAPPPTFGPAARCSGGLAPGTFQWRHTMNRSTAARSVPVLAALATLGIGVRAQAQCNAYTLTSATGVAIVPGTADSGNHADDVLTPLSFPFPVLFYGTSYTNAFFSSHGNLQFGPSGTFP